MHELTPFQRSAAEFIAGYVEEHKCPPTLALVAAHLGVARGMASDAIMRLEAKGWLLVEKRKNRFSRMKLLKSLENPVDAIAMVCYARGFKGEVADLPEWLRGRL